MPPSPQLPNLLPGVMRCVFAQHGARGRPLDLFLSTQRSSKENLPMYLAKRTPSDVAKAPSPQPHKLYVYVLSVFGRQKKSIYIYMYLYVYLCQYDLPTPRASIREVRVQEERPCGATGIPPLQMQGSKKLPNKLLICLTPVFLWQPGSARGKPC